MAKLKWLRLLLVGLILGQGIPLPLLATPANFSLRINADYTGDPKAITDIVAQPDFSAPVASGKIKLNWTAPAAANGEKVVSYIIKYATFSVESLGGNTTFWWNHPNCLTALELDTPPNWGRMALANPSQNEVISISGLVPGQYYWVSVRALDKYHRIADYDLKIKGLTTQTSAYATTEPYQPDRITSLLAQARIESGEISLNWTVPTFWTGSANVSHKIIYPGEYCIQYSTVSIDPDTIYRPNYSNNWPASTRIYFSTYNITTGDIQYVTLTGLSMNTTYYFAVFVRTEWPDKWSLASKPLGMAKPYFRIRPVGNLSAAAAGSTDENIGSYINLTWTNPPAEDFFAGVRVCYSTNTYPASPTDGNYFELTDLLPDGTTTYQHKLLTPRTSYYYSIYAFDTNHYFSSATYTSVYTGIDLIAPDAPTQLTTLLTLDNSGPTDIYRIQLTWINPAPTPTVRNADFASIKIYYSTVSYDGALNNLLTDLPGNPSEIRSYTHENLIPYLTYYYVLKSADKGNNQSISSLSGLFYISPDYVPPSPPTLLLSNCTASVSLNPAYGANITLSWQAPTETQLMGVKVIYRTDRYPVSVSDGSELYNWTGSTGAVYTPTFYQLQPNTSYYVALFAYSYRGLNSRPTRITLYTKIGWLDNLAPFKPLALRTIRQLNTTKLIWENLKYNNDRRIFRNPAEPQLDELYYYELWRSTDIFGGWEKISQLSAKATYYNDNVLTENYYYRLKAVDASGNYSYSDIVSVNRGCWVASSAGDLLGLSNAQYQTLFAADGSAQNYIFDIVRNLSEENQIVYKSIELKLYSVEESSSELKLSGGDNYSGKKYIGASINGQLFVRIDETNPALARAISAAGADKQNVCLMFYDGTRWLFIGGQRENSYLTAPIRFTGKYQLRFGESPTEFTFRGVRPKIITPNGDNTNDLLFFEFVNPKSEPVTITIRNLSGGLIKTISTNNSSLISNGYVSWDGRDEAGEIVLPGVYIYQIECGGKLFNGTLVVAR